MAALQLLAAQSTQLARVDASSALSMATPTATYPGLSAPVYPYERAAPHPLLSGALRRGKWTQEEEEYAASIIQHFLSGVLPIQYGTTLRGYIAQLLHCDPMRVSKKLVPGSVFVGVRIDPKIGRRSYYPCPVDTPGLDEHKEHAERHLARLRVAFIESIEREEPSEPDLKLPHFPASATSPLKRKRFEDADPTRHVGEASTGWVASTHGEVVVSGGQSLPSLSDMLLQKRLRTPSPVVSHRHVGSYPPRLHQTSPPPAAWHHLASPTGSPTDHYSHHEHHEHHQNHQLPARAPAVHDTLLPSLRSAMYSSLPL